MKFTLEETPEFLTLPDDVVVPVSVEAIELRDVPGRNGGSGWQKLSFRFKIVDLPDALVGEYAALIGSTVFGSVSAKFTTHPDNKLRAWSEALLGLDLSEPGFELDADMLIGRKARAIIGSYAKKDSTQRNNQVTALLPLVSNAVSGPANTPEPSFFDEPPF